MIVTSSGFVEDGVCRLLDIIEPLIRDAVEAEYAGRLADVAWFERWRLRREMAREVKRRIGAEVSVEALF